MRDGSLGMKVLTSLVLALGLALGACGSGTQEQRDPGWQARERVPQVAEHWWHEPVERACDEDADCEQGQRCQNMRLGTCAGCPRGEEAKMCVGEPTPREGNRRRAKSR